MELLRMLAIVLKLLKLCFGENIVKFPVDSSFVCKEITNEYEIIDAKEKSV